MNTRTDNDKEALHKRIKTYAFEALATNYTGNYEKMADDLAYDVANYFEKAVEAQKLKAQIEVLEGLEKRTESTLDATSGWGISISKAREAYIDEALEDVKQQLNELEKGE